MYATYTGDRYPTNKGHEYFIGQDILNAYFMEQIENIRHGKQERMDSLNTYVSEKIDNGEVHGHPISDIDRRFILHFINL